MQQLKELHWEAALRFKCKRPTTELQGQMGDWSIVYSKSWNQIFFQHSIEYTRLESKQ